jgi:type VI secretion system secreted protein VgrG
MCFWRGPLRVVTITAVSSAGRAERIGAAMTLTQATREIAIHTPLGEDALLLRSFRGQEHLSRLFSFELDLASENASIAYNDIVGKNVTLIVNLADGSERYWNGWVSRFLQLQRDSVASSYRATMVPWLWFLGQTTDCRIFQNKSVPDLLKQIFKENGYSDFALKLQGDFAPRDYCVQYRESDLNFVSRLMEEEGIFYFFEHEKSKHTLVLGNDPSAIKPCSGQAKARYEGSAGGWKDDDVILEWSQEQEFRPGAYSTTDYNFETPSTSLLSSAKGNRTKWELYDFPGEFLKRADGDKLARVRLEEQQMPQLIARGKSDCRSFVVGHKFSLIDHYRDDLNQDYVLTSLHHAGRHDIGYTSGADASAEPVYENAFQCVPASTPIRPPRITPIPVVQGCHTAVVVGPAGEEIFTDKYGRVKVQFHWDREGKHNESSSCWVRVSYPTAGKAWGGIQIPRIGQEVIVDFIEGDPDRPIITGRTYNAGQMPPYDLPGKGMVSGFKSNSTKGGGGYNELAFDDTKGNELIRVHGQFDMDSVIEHDERRHIKNNRSKNIDMNETSTIGVNRTEKVGSNEQITIGANRTENVGSNESITVALTRTRNVGVNEMVNIGGAQEITIGGLQALTVGGARAKTIGIGEVVNIGAMQSINVGASQTVTIGATQSVTVAAAQTHTIGASQTTTIGAGQTVSIASDLGETIGGGHTESVASDRSATIGGGDTIGVGKAFALTAADEISLTTGEASIVMKKDGTITISGKNITVNGKDIAVTGSGKINVEATGVMTLKGSKILQN